MLTENEKGSAPRMSQARKATKRPAGTEESTNLRRARRYSFACPAVLKVLFPERSFIPESLAVRVMNLSSGGALVEIHEDHVEDKKSAWRGCYFEMRVAPARDLALFGRVARVEQRGSRPMLGLMFHHSYEEVIGRLVHGDQIPSAGSDGAALGLPLLDPYSPICEEPQIVLSGRAAGALHLDVLHVNGDLITSAPVTDGRFVATVNLPSAGEHALVLIARGEDVSSPGLPVSISCVPLTREDFFLKVVQSEEGTGAPVLGVDYLGPGAPCREILARAGELASGAMRARFSIRAALTSRVSPADIKSLQELAELLRRTPPEE